MSDRTIRTRLVLEIKDFQAQMAAAAEASRKGAADIDRNGQKITTSLGKVARSMEVNRESWQRAGGALTAYAVVLGGVAAAILNTGIAYNTLQQSSRAALKTVLGSTTAVNEQMEKLDTFARTSPFAKQVFLTAQQQMLAFGIETQKVIPYLDALQNAVAAAGGNNQTLAELAQIISKVHAAGKLTAQDFIEFGNRGVDAATLIGSQMGKSGAAIRESVTKGLLDADDALDALIKGMDQKFGGAADNVKQTYVGALDRVKAAWRDLASDITAPLVDPNGGGALVDWMNDLADAMRSFQRLPDSMKAVIVGVVGLTGALALLSGGFLVMAPRIAATREAFATLTTQMPKTTRAMGVMGKAAGVLAIALAGIQASAQAMAAQAPDAIEVGVGKATDSLLDLARGADLADTSLSAMFTTSQYLKSGKDAFGILTDPSWSRKVNDNVGKFIGGLTGLGDSVRDLETVQSEKFFDSLDQGLAGLVGSGELDSASQSLDAITRQLGVSRDDLLAFLPAYTDALAGVDAQQKLVANSGALTVEQMKAQEDAAKAAAEAYDKWRETIESGFSSFIDVNGAYQAVIDKTKEWAQAQANATKSTKDSADDFFDGHTVKVNEFIKELQDQVDAQKKWSDAVADLQDRINNDVAGNLQGAGNTLLDSLVGQGSASAPLLEMLSGASDAQLNKILGLYQQGGSEAAAAFGDAYEQNQNPAKITVDMSYATKQYGDWVNAMSAKVIQVHLQIGEGTPAKRPGGGGGGVPRRYAGGGGVFGPGSGTSDSILARLSAGEHVWTAGEVAAAGGHGAVEMMRAAFRGSHTPAMVQTPAPQVVTVPVSSTHTMSAPATFTGPVYLNQPGDAGLAALDRLNRKSGGR